MNSARRWRGGEVTCASAEKMRESNRNDTISATCVAVCVRCTVLLCVRCTVLRVCGVPCCYHLSFVVSSYETFPPHAFIPISRPLHRLGSHIQTVIESTVHESIVAPRAIRQILLD